jgi:glycerophosphoryl diester phosphodiesterase
MSLFSSTLNRASPSYAPVLPRPPGTGPIRLAGKPKEDPLCGVIIDSSCKNQGPGGPKLPTDGKGNVTGLGPGSTPKTKNEVKKTPKPTVKKTPKPPEMTPEQIQRRVTESINPKPPKETPIQREIKEQKLKDAEQKKQMGITERRQAFKGVKLRFALSEKSQVRVGATDKGIVFMEVPKQIYPPAPGRRITLPGITTASTDEQISKSVKRLAASPQISYVYAKDGRPIYNPAGPGRPSPIFANFNNIILAHAGSLEKKPVGFEILEWQNKIKYGIQAAFDQKVSIVELDMHVNLASRETASGPEAVDKIHLKHDPKGRAIDSNGKHTGAPAVDMIHGNRAEVAKVADSLSDTLQQFDRVKYPNTTFALEMKKDTGLGIPMSHGYAERMASALYSELKRHDRREDVLITSMEPEMLERLNGLAKADGVKMNLMLVLPLHGVLTKEKVEEIRRDMPYVKFVAFPTDGPPNPFPLNYPGDGKAPPASRSQTKIDAVKLWQSYGGKAVGWNWDPTYKSEWCPASNDRANELGLNGMISDCPSLLRESDSKWK